MICSSEGNARANRRHADCGHVVTSAATFSPYCVASLDRRGRRGTGLHCDPTLAGKKPLSLELWWLGQSGFRLRADGSDATVFCDPFLSAHPGRTWDTPLDA